MNRLITVQNAIQQLLSEKETVIVAIDGNCTSGKTTLASQLAANYDCNIFHIDDFSSGPNNALQRDFLRLAAMWIMKGSGRKF